MLYYTTTAPIWHHYTKSTDREDEMDMTSSEAYEIIRGVVSILEEESHEAGSERLFACMAALDHVAAWLDEAAEEPCENLKK